MASNPLDDDNDPAIRERIERRAYHLWQEDGEPHGRHDEYWERARELVHMELAGNTGQLPNPASLPGADPNAPDRVDEAFIQENLGEFPDRFADQGEKTATPKARAGARPRRKVEAAPPPPEPEPPPAPVKKRAPEPAKKAAPAAVKAAPPQKPAKPDTSARPDKSGTSEKSAKPEKNAKTEPPAAAPRKGTTAKSKA